MFADHRSRTHGISTLAAPVRGSATAEFQRSLATSARPGDESSMKRRRTAWILLALAAGASLASMFAVPAVAVAKPSFEPASCGDLPDSGDALSRLRCGVVRVPRDHTDPDGPTFALAVVVVGSARQPALPDPVVYISGGPGAPLTIYAGFQARHPYAADRDLVLVDQRGMGRSEPRLCPGTGGVPGGMPRRSGLRSVLPGIAELLPTGPGSAATGTTLRASAPAVAHAEQPRAAHAVAVRGSGWPAGLLTAHPRRTAPSDHRDP